MITALSTLCAGLYCHCGLGEKKVNASRSHKGVCQRGESELRLGAKFVLNFAKLSVTFKTWSVSHLALKEREGAACSMTSNERSESVSSASGAAVGEDVSNCRALWQHLCMSQTILQPLQILCMTPQCLRLV